MSFQIKSNRKETENKTIRFPMPLIQEIETAIQNQDVSFSSFVIQACEYALEKNAACKSLAEKKKEYIRRLTNNIFSYTKEQLFALCGDYPHLFQEHLNYVKESEKNIELPPTEFQTEDHGSWNRLCEKIRKKYGQDAI